MGGIYLQKSFKTTSVFSYDENVLADKYYQDIEGEIERQDEYLERKREVDMSVLLERVIENDLSDTQRRVLKKIAVDGQKAQMIAEELSVNISTVYRIYNNAVEKIRELLKYAVMYQRDCLKEELLPLDIKKYLCCLAIKNFSEKSINHRIRALMMRERISLNQLCEACGIEEKRMKLILESTEQISPQEAVVISVFLNTTTDYLLKGEKNEQNFKRTG